MDEEIQMTIMQLILHGGNARSYAIDAIRAARDNDFNKADELLNLSDAELVEAHQVQTDLLFRETSGSPVEMSLLMIHGQDHVMNAMTVKDLAKEIVENLRK